MGNEQRDVRIQKRAELLEMGILPYRDRYERTHILAEAKTLAIGTDGVRIAGRIMTMRVFGRLIFATIKDFSEKMQIALQEKTLGKENFLFFKRHIDIGDFIGASGRIFQTKTGEITLDTASFELLSKTVRPLPEKWHGVTEREILYRQRYLDLVMNEGTMERFIKRTKIIKSMRSFLDSADFIEVETPVLQTRPSGAIAAPFITHHNALDMALYLRIAPETYLKRCIAGGFDRVYEFARSFRNEGMDPSHLQDFTILEYYAAYWNYRDNMRFIEGLIKHVLLEINGSPTLVYGGNEIDFGKVWDAVPLRDIIRDDTGIDIYEFSDADNLRNEVKKRNIEILDIDDMGYGTLIDNLFKKVSRPSIQGPLFITHHPIELSPLARKNDRK